VDNATTSRLVALCFDALDPHVLAKFWAAALGWDVADDGVTPVRVVPSDHTDFEFWFLPTDEPKTALQNRLHLDLTTSSLDDQAQSVERLLELGGRHIDIGQSPDEGHVVLADPDGNELCLIEPGNNFLAGCERLGAISCDGSREVGYFWNAVLGWPLVWDQNEETAIREVLGNGPMITWGGPPLMAKPPRNRLHLAIAPPPNGDLQAELDRLTLLGAQRDDTGARSGDWIDLIDPDGNEFRLLSPR
jgi:hypothetical protein